MQVFYLFVWLVLLCFSNCPPMESMIKYKEELTGGKTTFKKCIHMITYISNVSQSDAHWQLSSSNYLIQVLVPLSTE